MIRYDANKLMFEQITIDGQPALFTKERVSFSTVEPPLYMYEVQHNHRNPSVIALEVRKDFYGTVLLPRQLDSNYKKISNWEGTGYKMNNAQFIQNICK